MGDEEVLVDFDECETGKVREELLCSLQKVDINGLNDEKRQYTTCQLQKRMDRLGSFFG
ncbi:hypothetical protein M3172_23550 [Mesobacillus subterraneus]|uniref:hypothetical protein n=1 Tax=Mesobacillus subterraneus TaxID=285983 RepID=UPI00203F8DFB|nr:hypothetical protein [Mesobacillus subterraneus]MCM3576150.1 hypothetical protein [Mesobacillus subterraneus]